MNSRMGKWVLWAAAGLFGCSLNLLAQTNQRGDLLMLNQSRLMSGRGVDLSRLSAHYGFPWLTLANGHPVSLSSGYDWIEPAPFEFLPVEDAEVSAKVQTARASEMDSNHKTVAVKPKLVDYVHGEVGALYGTSVGSKFGREVEAGYILGEIGNDKYRINVGAFYEHSSAHFPRR